jgi:hypothetical protein
MQRPGVSLKLLSNKALFIKKLSLWSFYSNGSPLYSDKVGPTFFNNIYKLHGLPESIVSDRDPIFTSTFWRELFKAIGTEQKLSLHITLMVPLNV